MIFFIIILIACNEYDIQVNVAITFVSLFKSSRYPLMKYMTVV